MAERILILGASARATAASARRAGLVPFAIDLFADADTERICERVWRCPPDRYPQGLFELAKQAPPMPWMYTGGLENYPELVGELARKRELWGNGPEVLRRVRDPRWLADQQYLQGIMYPAVVVPGDGAPHAGEWIRKPLRGSGGLNVRPADEDDLSAITDPGCGYFLQEFVNGMPASVAFRGPTLLGMTLQLVGTPWLHATGYQYAGNVTWAPHPLMFEIPETLGRIHQMSGVWGADLLVVDGWCALVEINPRYPASVEAIEFATGRPALVPSDRTFNPRRRKVAGKAVYYAPRPLIFPESGPWDVSYARADDVWIRPDFADIPYPGEIVEPRRPVLTILAAADNVSDCLGKLRSRAAELDRLFGFVPSPLEGEG